MMRPIIIFDFDKTLTEKDTIFGFYKQVSGNTHTFKLKLPLFYFFAILAKLKIMSNDSLKKWGIWLFLRKLNRQTIQKKGKEYASVIKMSPLYESHFKKYPAESVIVLSASFEEYLAPLFPSHSIAGSRILFNSEGIVNGLERNLYGEKKLDWIRNKGIETIDILYTDSYADRPLMEISKQVYLVENGNKIKIDEG